jgi:hypothetical protein
MAKYPFIYEKPSVTMAVVTGIGNPNDTMGVLIPALYEAVYGLKFDIKKKKGETFKVGKMVARWPDAHLVPMDKWTIHVGIAIPDGTRDFPKMPENVEVKIEKWKYGKVAEILHKGPYSGEAPTIKALMEFIESQGYEIAGDHEEEYLTSPMAQNLKTLIRYPVRRKR